MEAYTGFAQVYDQFMEDVPYEDWLNIIHTHLKNEAIEDGLILDLGCGTGTMTRLLADQGYDMIGIDGSEEMLMEARAAEYETDRSRPILYLCQDMREFELYGTVRAIVSICDCMNYMLTKEDLTTVFRLANNYLDPGGIFLFDMNTPYKFREVMGNRTIAENGEGASFIWDNYYDAQTGRNEYDLTLFIEQENGLYERVEEVHEQQGYEIHEVKTCAERAGMEFVTVFDAVTLSEPTDQSERLFYLFREKGKTR